MSDPCFSPLSWSYRPPKTHQCVESTIPRGSLRLKSISLRGISLRGSSVRFCPFATHSCDTKEQLAQQINAELQMIPTILRGIPEPLSRLLHLPQYRIVPFGSEAIVNLRGYSLPSSVRQLARRALRNGAIFSPCRLSTPQMLPIFPSRRASTALRGLFRRAPSRDQDCFVFTAAETAVPVAWITVSRRSEHHRHVEQLQRSSVAPVGVMEALLVHAIEYLQGQGVATLSLGEVPCIIPDNAMLTQGVVSARVFRALNRVGKKVLEPRYSPEGLYVFKNKFNPSWEPVYWIIPKQRGVTAFIRTLISTGVIPLIFERETKRF